MDWIFYTKIVAFVITVVVVWVVFKELKGAIKDDRDGKKSSKCELD